jgi:hypothetical protein
MDSKVATWDIKEAVFVTGWFGLCPWTSKSEFMTICCSESSSGLWASRCVVFRWILAPNGICLLEWKGVAGTYLESMLKMWLVDDNTIFLNFGAIWPNHKNYQNCEVYGFNSFKIRMIHWCLCIRESRGLVSISVDDKNRSLPAPQGRQLASRNSEPCYSVNHWTFYSIFLLKEWRNYFWSSENSG